jgi:hypothetical protein
MRLQKAKRQAEPPVPPCSTLWWDRHSACRGFCRGLLVVASLLPLAAQAPGPPAPPAAKAETRNCTVCHQKIHGSHVDRNLLR